MLKQNRLASAKLCGVETIDHRFEDLGVVAERILEMFYRDTVYPRTRRRRPESHRNQRCQTTTDGHFSIAI